MSSKNTSDSSVARRQLAWLGGASGLCAASGAMITGRENANDQIGTTTTSAANGYQLTPGAPSIEPPSPRARPPSPDRASHHSATAAPADDSGTLPDDGTRSGASRSSPIRIRNIATVAQPIAASVTRPSSKPALGPSRNRRAAGIAQPLTISAL